MKRVIATLSLLVLAYANAADVKTPPLPQPPPYGAYFLDMLLQPPAEYKAAQEAIARHYGYKSNDAAARACMAATHGMCFGEAVSHRRDESPEIAKYGFKTWHEAVRACAKNFKPREFGPYDYCQADPFLKLRMSQMGAAK
ncbi:hypothetical protein [Ramlibacter sp.]|uniref:hypothetical protein n=1 Tax=Ramlibacter sp. TaxID=1917967 RepID=UPI002BC2B5FD|nr:hypothetical protein [Ramlibacter sp.]HWI83840.1 hypothetical protein [Ramlibacter sp.]